MSYFVPQTNNYFGLAPVGAYPQSNLYLVSSSEANDINIGDLLVFSTIGTVKRGVPANIVLTSSNGSPGVAASALTAGSGSTAATINSNSSKMVMVWDDPNQIFGITDSSSGIVGGQDMLFKNYAILATGVVGTTGPMAVGNASRSAMALSGVSATAAGAVHLIGLHPVESGVFSTRAAGTAAVDCRKWLVKLISNVNAASTGLTSVVNTTS